MNKIDDKRSKKKNHPQGLRVLYHVIKDRDWNLLDDNGLLADAFRGESQEVLGFVRNYESETGEFPPVDFTEESTGIKFPANIPKEKALKSLKRWQQLYTLHKVVNRARRDLEISDPEACLSTLTSGIADIEPLQPVIGFKTEAQLRYEDYLKRKKEGAKGIVPMFPTLAEAINVYENGTLNMFLGVPSSGKSWFSSASSIWAAYGLGKKVLHISMENSKHSIESRMDALYHKIPFGDIKAGMVDMFSEQRWVDQIPTMEAEYGDIWLLDQTSVTTVEDVHQLVVSKKPDFVVIDGTYKLTTKLNGGGDGYNLHNNVLQALHNASAVSDVPWLGTSQLNAGATSATGGRETAFEASFTKAYLRDPATVVAILNSEESMLQNRATMRICKVRDGGDMANKSMEFEVNANRETMNFMEADEDYINEEIMDMTF